MKRSEMSKILLDVMHGFDGQRMDWNDFYERHTEAIIVAIEKAGMLLEWEPEDE